MRYNGVNAVRVSVLGLLLLLVAGCGTKGDTKSAPEADAPPLERPRRIAMFAISEPPVLTAANLGGAKMLLGGVGRILEEQEAATKTTQFTQAIRKHDVAVGQTLQQALIQQLAQVGFEVSLIESPNRAPADPDSFDYSTVKVTADAIMHAWFTHSRYISYRTSLSYKPQLNTVIRLVSTRSNEDLVYQYMYYGADTNSLSETTIPSDNKYHFKSFDALIANAGVAAEALMAGARATGAQFSDWLRTQYF